MGGGTERPVAVEETSRGGEALLPLVAVDAGIVEITGETEFFAGISYMLETASELVVLPCVVVSGDAVAGDDESMVGECLVCAVDGFTKFIGLRHEAAGVTSPTRGPGTQVPFDIDPNRMIVDDSDIVHAGYKLWHLDCSMAIDLEHAVRMGAEPGAPEQVVPSSSGLPGLGRDASILQGDRMKWIGAPRSHHWLPT